MTQPEPTDVEKLVEQLRDFDIVHPLVCHGTGGGPCDCGADELIALKTEAATTISDLTRSWQLAEKAYSKAFRRADDAEEQVAALRDALATYGRHKQGCRYWTVYYENAPLTAEAMCNCGYREAAMATLTTDTNREAGRE